MKTRATIRNSAASLLYYGFTVAAGILLRKAIIVFLGIEYQGIDGLFTSIISLLSIAELGFGTAIVSNLYEPLETGNRVRICSLMRYYRKCCRLIAFSILCAGLCLIPVLPYLVREYSLPYPIASIYIWFLLDCAASYLLSWRRGILIADQKQYVVSLADALYMVLTKSIQVVILWKTGNYFGMLAFGVAARVFENLGLYFYTNRAYPYLKESGSTEPEPSLLSDIRRKVKGAVFHKIGSFVVNSTDSILISMYLGLAASGIYSNYFIIVRAVQNICTKTVSAATASIGHLLTEKNSERAMEVFHQLQLINLLMSCLAVTGVYCVCSDVVAALFGTEFTVDQFTLFFIALNLGCQCMREVFKAYKEAAGILYEDRFVPVIETAVNILASVLLLQRFGLAGVFMGTILCEAVLYGYTYPVLIYGRLLKGNCRQYLMELVWQIAVILASMFLGNRVCGLLRIESVWMRIVLHSMAAVLSAFFCTYFLFGCWRKECRQLFKKAGQLLGNR